MTAKSEPPLEALLIPRVGGVGSFETPKTYARRKTIPWDTD